MPAQYRDPRGFWAAILGVALERAALGETFDEASAEATVELVLNLYNEPDRSGKGPAIHGAHHRSR